MTMTDALSTYLWSLSANWCLSEYYGDGHQHSSMIPCDSRIDYTFWRMLYSRSSA